MTQTPGRLYIVTGQLPIEFREDKGQVQVMSSGGDESSGISAFLQHRVTGDNPEFSGVGWAGIALCEPAIWQSLMPPVKGYDWCPVFLPEKHQQTLSQGFANTVLWPLFHYFPSYVEFSPTAYEDYLDMNRLFAEQLAQYLRPGDTVWIHDHQLLPLAASLRRYIPGLTIGLFVHISFPSYELFRHLPGHWQEELLRGMLGADLIGFQTAEYASLFRNCVRLTVDTAGDNEIIEFEGRRVRTGSFPMGIDYLRFSNAGETKETRQIAADLIQRFHAKRIIFSIDELDYTKGILHRINACEYFLQQYPDSMGEVIFILVIIPSHEDLTRYTERKKLIDETVSYVNGRFGKLDWQPLLYMYRSLDFGELLSLYRLCDIALLTPLRDAMNLYAKEFVASRNDESGVLILSQFDGAVEQLSGALCVNPNDVPDVARTIKAALDIPSDEQQQRMQEMRRSVSMYDIYRWGKDFLLALKNSG